MKQVHKVNNGIEYNDNNYICNKLFHANFMPIVLNKHCSEHYIN